MRFENDTIAAISTPVGQGGIGIVRISGPLSFDIADRIFRPKKAGTPWKRSSTIPSWCCG